MTDFEKLIKLNLWANQADFIMSRDYVMKSFPKMLNTKARDPFIACNQIEEAWKVITDRNHAYNVIAFVCDNVGFEFFLELCIADYLYTNYYARTIHFHVKHIPWFMSDIMEKDIHWLLYQLYRNPERHIQELAAAWKDHFKSGRWKIFSRKFWSLPIGFTRMRKIDPVLYKLLEETKMVIIKGDLNYRKLLEDKNLDPSTPITEALQDFHPSNLLLIRIMKCDVVCNIPRLDVEKFEKLDKNWLDCGHYGLIQFAPKPSEECDCTSI